MTPVNFMTRNFVHASHQATSGPGKKGRLEACMPRGTAPDKPAAVARNVTCQSLAPPSASLLSSTCKAQHCTSGRSKAKGGKEAMEEDDGRHVEKEVMNATLVTCGVERSSSGGLAEVHLRTKHAFFFSEAKLFASGCGCCNCCKVTFGSRPRLLAHLTDCRRSKCLEWCTSNATPMESDEIQHFFEPSQGVGTLGGLFFSFYDFLLMFWNYYYYY